tara:strand:+ start:3936 stop:4772 length:837 start_codon:yes stop_codon:yes gene_type:complete
MKLLKIITLFFYFWCSLSFGNINSTCNYNINIGSFNIESSQSDINVIQKQIVENSDIKIWGIVESSNQVVNNILKGLQEHGDFKVISGTTGGGNLKMQIFYDSTNFRPLYQTELHYINYKNRVRSPLVVKFEDLKSNQKFYVMLNHLYRSNKFYRHKQAELINQWAKEIYSKENIPVLAIGDYNFDMYYKDITKRDVGFENMIKDNIFKWVKPNVLYPTQCSRHKSILDFIFISDSSVTKLQASSDILYRYEQYCSYKRYFSDHRPVVAYVNYDVKCK